METDMSICDRGGKFSALSSEKYLHANTAAYGTLFSCLLRQKYTLYCANHYPGDFDELQQTL